MGQQETDGFSPCALKFISFPKQIQKIIFFFDNLNQYKDSDDCEMAKEENDEFVKRYIVAENRVNVQQEKVNKKIMNEIKDLEEDGEKRKGKGTS